MKILFTSLALFLCLSSFSNSDVNTQLYKQAYQEIKGMLEGKSSLDFKRAVFLSENPFYNNTLSYSDFCRQIDEIEAKLYQFIKDENLSRFKTCKQYAIYNYMTHPSKYNNQSIFSYDFEDFLGYDDWKSMFVTKLLATNVGQCHSLPYLFKILAEEVKAEAYLSLLPNHMYIKHIDENGKWVNVELTNHSFPVDGHYIRTTGVSIESIKNGMYMQPLDLKKSIALCLWDLAMTHKAHVGRYSDFFLDCVNTALKYFPEAEPILGSKANALQSKYVILKQKEEQNAEQLSDLVIEIKATFKIIDDLGYVEEPEHLYQEWKKSLDERAEKERLAKQSKYSN